MDNEKQKQEVIDFLENTYAALTEEHFLDALQKMWDHGAQGEYFSFVNANVKRMINALASCGAWSLSLVSASSTRYRDVGGRLLYVPQTKISA